MSLKDRSPIPDSEVTKAILIFASAAPPNARTTAAARSAQQILKSFHMCRPPSERRRRRRLLRDRSTHCTDAPGLLHEGRDFFWNKSPERGARILERGADDHTVRDPRDLCEVSGVDAAADEDR